MWNGCQLEIINSGQTQTALKTDEGKVIQIPNQELSNLVRTGAIQIVPDSETKNKEMELLSRFC